MLAEALDFVHLFLATPPPSPEAASAAQEAGRALGDAVPAVHDAHAAKGGIDWSVAKIFTATGLAALLTLVTMEVILGIDNVIFIAVLTEKLPPEQAPRARRLGILAAMVMRLVLLFSITWIMTLKATLFTAMGHAVTGKDLVLLAGGAFLIYKATREIHHKLEDDPEAEMHRKASATFAAVIVQIMILDIVFSLDSVITAVGMADGLIWIMVTAVLISVGVMLVAANPIAEFVKKHPTTKMLALAFLMLIGVMLVADGMGHHVPKGYIYAAMAFSVLVEALNLAATRAAKKRRAAQGGAPAH